MEPAANFDPAPALTADPPVAPRGAPSQGEVKRDAIVCAAAAVFLEAGFGAASMDAIARKATVSKATIYSHFTNKHALFGAIVQGRCGTMMSAISGAETAGCSPEARLSAIARQFLDVLLMPGSLPLYRLVLAEAPRFPELGPIFYRSGPDRVAAAIAAYLEEQGRRGILNVADARLSAEQFLGMVLGHLHIKLLLGILPEPPGPEERAHLVATAVSTFLDGHRRR
jgi:TetR/AcrR family transcriptional repressor of mexJK operon